MIVLVHDVRNASPVAPSAGRYRPLGMGEVQLTGGYWGGKQEVNGRATLGHILKFLEGEGWLANFDKAAAGTLPAGRRGREFADSEIYKYLEAVAWEISRTGDDALEADFRAVTARVAAAQEADGYVHTHFGRPGQGARWSDLEWGHELYCMGHLFQAAVARVRTRPDADDGLVTVATRAADLICEVFGEGGIESVCGHAEVETALAELGRAVGQQRYVDQARLFIERRGRGTLADIEFGRSYFQDDVPVREATSLRGHAVRANYLSSGAVDVAVESGDTELVDVLARQWAHTVACRTYLTGGQGSHHQDEAFGEDWVLPSDRAYSETCAGIASIQFSWRLLLARGGAHYADLIERTLYNVVATSPSESGTAFFYANTLHQRVPGVEADLDAVSPRASSSLRAPWFEVSCCPPNVARTLASLATYVATTDDAGLQVHQHVAARVRTELPDGTRIAADIETDYPASGEVRVTVLEDAPREWTLSLRVPAWARGATLAVGAGAPEPVAPGYAEVARVFAAGDVVTLALPLEPRFTVPDPRIDAIRGSVAVERGPEVLCLESHELEAAGVAAIDGMADVVLDPTVAPREVDGAVVVSLGTASATVGEWPYASVPAGDTGADFCEVALVPYRTWGNRGPSTMRVWLPT